MLAGFEHYLVKPVEPAELINPLSIMVVSIMVASQDRHEHGQATVGKHDQASGVDC